MKTLSIIDIGSNSIKLLISNLYSKTYYDIICEEKVPFRISQYLTANQTLTDEGLEKLINILSYFKHLSDSHQVEIILAIATEATRRLKNSEKILEQIKQQLGIVVELLPGEMEAYYGYLATLHTIEQSDYLQIDIGGSSMEVVLVKNKRLVQAISLPLGAIVTSKQFDLGEEITSEKLKKFQSFIQSEFNNISWLKEAIHLPIIGIGGTVRMISKIYRNQLGDNFKLQHLYTLTSKNIENVYDFLAPLSLKERLAVKGMTKERADIVLGCLMTIRSLMSYIDSKELIINRYGIRQGLIFKQLDIPTYSVLDYSLCNLLNHFKLDKHHNDCLKQSSLTLANQLEMTDVTSVKILKTISKLHQVGQIISYQNINKHTFYLLMNVQVNGLAPKEQLMAAYAIKYLDRSNFKSEHPTILSETDLINCKKFALILQLSNYLTVLNEEFTAIHVKEHEIQLHFSNSIPTIYTDKLENLSKQYQEIFKRKLTIKDSQ